MTTSGDGQRPVGLVVGSLIGTVFGLVFVAVNSGALAPHWSLAIRAGGAVAAAALVAGALWVWRSGPTVAAGMDARPPGWGFWAIVGGEAVALVGGLIVLDSGFGLPQLNIAWIALVVGAHFVALGAVFPVRAFYVVGAVLSLLGVMGFVLGAFGAPEGVIGLVSGVCSGVALFATIGVSLLGYTRHAQQR